MTARLYDRIKTEREAGPEHDANPEVTTASKIRRRLLGGEELSQSELEARYGISRTYFAGIRRELEAAGFVFETGDDHEVPATEKRWFLTNQDHEVDPNFARPKRKPGKNKKVKTTGAAKPVRRTRIENPVLIPGDKVEVRGIRRTDEDKLQIEIRNDNGTYTCTVESFKTL